MSSTSNNLPAIVSTKTRESLIKFIDCLDEGFELLELIFDKQDIVDFEFLEVNPSYEKQTGLKAVDLIGKRKKENAPAAEQRWYDYAIRAAKTGKTLQYEYYNNKVNRYFETQFIPISANQLAVMFKDITERKKAQEMLRESEEKYRALIEATNTGFLIIDKEGRVVDANEEYVRLTGHCSLQEILGRKVLEWTADFDKQKNAEAVNQCLRAGFIKDLVIHYIGKNRQVTPVEINAAVAGTVESTKIISLCRDITERERNEETLRASEAKYIELVEGLPEMVLEVDTQGHVVFANSKVLEMTGYSKKEIEHGFDANLLMAPQDFERSRENMKKMFTTGKRQSTEYLFAKKDGTLFPVLLNSIPILKDSRIVGIRGIIVDISERKNLEQQLKENERLAAIGATAGWVGHDIRNPLQAMLSDAYLLKDSFDAIPELPTRTEIAESLERLERNIGYINKIVADLQDYSKQLKPESVNINLYGLVTDVFVPFDLPANICPLINIDCSLEIRSDSTILRRIFTNLILNSIQAMPDGGELTISCQRNNSSLSIVVEDTGVGIPEDVKPKLFTPMMTTKAKGQGLGLAVVKRLVESLNGAISFESTVGKGTTFTIELPINR